MLEHIIALLEAGLTVSRYYRPRSVRYEVTQDSAIVVRPRPRSRFCISGTFREAEYFSDVREAAVRFMALLDALPPEAVFTSPDGSLVSHNPPLGEL